MKSFSAISVAALAAASVSAKKSHPLNDWTTPCFTGSCAYHTDQGSVQVWGNTTGISDITSAGGWEILNCDSEALDQEIRAVCTDSSKCEHIESGAGAVGTLVRLPEECGKGPFAHVAAFANHSDQSIPRSKRHLRRSNKSYVVKGITLSTDFKKAKTHHGAVQIAIQGSTNPSSAHIVSTTSGSQRRSRLSERSTTANGQQMVEKAFGSFNKNVSTTLPHISFSHSVPIFDYSVSCPDFEATVDATASISVDADVSLGLAAKGTIIPPNLSYAGVFAGLNADIDGQFTLKASAAGTVNVPLVDVYSTGIQGLNFPGILSLGPVFKVQAEASGNIDIGVDVTVAMQYKAENAKAFFPPSSNFPNGGAFTQTSAPVSLSVTPDLKASGTITAHIIPKLELDLSALGGIASADVYLAFDASAYTTLNLDASAEASTAIGGNLEVSASTSIQATDSETATATIISTSSEVYSTEVSVTEAPTTTEVASSTETVEVSNTSSCSESEFESVETSSTSSECACSTRTHTVTVVASPNPTSADASASATVTASAYNNYLKEARGVSGTISGCVDIGTELNVIVGAEGDFFGIFKGVKEASLFKKDWDLYNQCFQDSTKTSRRSLSARQLTPVKRTDLGCPASNLGDLGDLTSIVDQLSGSN